MCSFGVWCAAFCFGCQFKTDHIFAFPTCVSLDLCGQGTQCTRTLVEETKSDKASGAKPTSVFFTTPQSAHNEPRLNARSPPPPGASLYQRPPSKRIPPTTVRAGREVPQRRWHERESLFGSRPSALRGPRETGANSFTFTFCFRPDCDLDFSVLLSPQWVTPSRHEPIKDQSQLPSPWCANPTRPTCYKTDDLPTSRFLFLTQFYGHARLPKMIRVGQMCNISILTTHLPFSGVSIETVDFSRCV